MFSICCAFIKITLLNISGCFYYSFSSKINFKKILGRCIIIIFKHMRVHPECCNPDTHSVIDVKHKVKLFVNLTFPSTLSYIAKVSGWTQ